MSGHVSIKPFRFSNHYPYDLTAAFIGERRKGKSTACMYFIMKLCKDQVDRVVVCCGTQNGVYEWRRVAPALFIHFKDIEALRRIKEYQDDKILQCRKKWKGDQDDFSPPRKYRLLMVFDDCSSHKKFMSDDLVIELMCNGRHFGMGTIILAQYWNQLLTATRENMELLFIFALKNSKSATKVWEEAVGDNVVSKKMFMRIFGSVTGGKGDDNDRSDSEEDEKTSGKKVDPQKGKFCVVNNLTGSNKLRHRIFSRKLRHPKTIKWKVVGTRFIRKWAEDHNMESMEAELERQKGIMDARYKQQFAEEHSDTEDEEYIPDPRLQGEDIEDDPDQSEFVAPSSITQNHVFGNRYHFMEKGQVFTVQQETCSDTEESEEDPGNAADSGEEAEHCQTKRRSFSRPRRSKIGSYKHQKSSHQESHGGHRIIYK